MCLAAVREAVRIPLRNPESRSFETSGGARAVDRRMPGTVKLFCPEAVTGTDG